LGHRAGKRFAGQKPLFPQPVSLADLFVGLRISVAGRILGVADLAGFQQTLNAIPLLLLSLLITLALEGMVGIGFALCVKKPLKSLFLSSLLVNGITQPLLWLWLMIFFRQYLRALIVAEGLICVGEARLLKRLLANRLSGREALLLSLLMNGISFGIGLMLPF